jgi:hypothetical protein
MSEEARLMYEEFLTDNSTPHEPIEYYIEWLVDHIGMQREMTTTYQGLANSANQVIENQKKDLASVELLYNNTFERLCKLTDAIDNFLNDTREKESIEELERAMKDYGGKMENL